MSSAHSKLANPSFHLERKSGRTDSSSLIKVHVEVCLCSYIGVSLQCIHSLVKITSSSPLILRVVNEGHAGLLSQRQQVTEIPISTNTPPLQMIEKL